MSVSVKPDLRLGTALHGTKTLTTLRGSTGRTWHLCRPFMVLMSVAPSTMRWALVLWFYESLTLFQIYESWKIVNENLRWDASVTRTSYRLIVTLWKYFLLLRAFTNGTLVTSTRCWTWWSKSVVSSLRVSTLPTSTLACGRPRSPGTRRTWTSTALTTCTSDSPSHGQPFSSLIPSLCFLIISFCTVIHSWFMMRNVKWWQY